MINLPCGTTTTNFDRFLQEYHCINHNKITIYKDGYGRVKGLRSTKNEKNIYKDVRSATGLHQSCNDMHVEAKSIYKFKVCL
jgi:hypothetical protein